MRKGTSASLVRRVTTSLFGVLMAVVLTNPGAAHAAPPPPVDDIVDTVDTVVDDIVDDTEVFDVLDLEGFVFKNADLPEPMVEAVTSTVPNAEIELPATGTSPTPLALVAVGVVVIGSVLLFGSRLAVRRSPSWISRRANSC